MSQELRNFLQKHIKETPYHTGIHEVGRIYEDRPTRKAIIIYAGSAIHFKQYEPLAYRFVLEGYTVLALNLPGHGNEVSFRLGNGAEQLSDAVRHLQSKGYREIGAIGFSFGALSIMYSLLGFDYDFERRIQKELGALAKMLGEDFATLLKKKKIQEIYNKYDEVKHLVHESIKRSYVHFAQKKVSSGRPDAVIFAGFPVSLIKSTKLLCPRALSLSYGWMRFTTNTFFNTPPALLKKIINGLERHEPIEEATYEDENAVYLKFFKLSSEKEMNTLKEYLHQATTDPDALLPLLAMFENKEYMNYFFRRLRKIPKFFMYGKKDAIASGSFMKEVVSRVFGRSKGNIGNESLTYLLNLFSKEAKVKIYPGLGHTLDERAGFIKKLSRRPQNIHVQNDMVAFMNRFL